MEEPREISDNIVDSDAKCPTNSQCFRVFKDGNRNKHFCLVANSKCTSFVTTVSHKKRMIFVDYH